MFRGNHFVETILMYCVRSWVCYIDTLNVLRYILVVLSVCSVKVTSRRNYKLVL